VHKTFRAYGDYQIKNSFDEFYAKEAYEIPKINVIDLSRELLISKETTRRKILEMERDGAIKKDKKRIMINRKGQEYQKPKDSIRNMSRLLSKFTDFLSKAGYLDKKVENSVLDKKIRDSNLPEDIRIGAIVRKNKVIIPRSNFIFEKDDLVVFLAKREQLKAVEGIFSVGSI